MTARFCPDQSCPTRPLSEKAAPVADLILVADDDAVLRLCARAWHAARARATGVPRLRLAPLAALGGAASGRHTSRCRAPVLTREAVAGARGVAVVATRPDAGTVHAVARLSGWLTDGALAVVADPAGAAEAARAAVVHPGLPASTLDRLWRLLAGGGVPAARAALVQWALACGVYVPPAVGPKRLPAMGLWTLDGGAACAAARLLAVDRDPRPRVLLAVDRQMIASADTAGVTALVDALAARGLDVWTLFSPPTEVPAGPGRWLARQARLIGAGALVDARAPGAAPVPSGGLPAIHRASFAPVRPGPPLPLGAAAPPGGVALGRPVLAPFDARLGLAWPETHGDGAAVAAFAERVAGAIPAGVPDHSPMPQRLQAPHTVLESRAHHGRHSSPAVSADRPAGDAFSLPTRVVADV